MLNAAAWRLVCWWCAVAACWCVCCVAGVGVDFFGVVLIYVLIYVLYIV